MKSTERATMTFRVVAGLRDRPDMSLPEHLWAWNDGTTEQRSSMINMAHVGEMFTPLLANAYPIGTTMTVVTKRTVTIKEPKR